MKGPPSRLVVTGVGSGKSLLVHLGSINSNNWLPLLACRKRLIAGDGVYICDECIGLCNEIIEEEFPRVETFGLQEELPKPRRSAISSTST